MRNIFLVLISLYAGATFAAGLVDSKASILVPIDADAIPILTPQVTNYSGPQKTDSRLRWNQS